MTHCIFGSSEKNTQASSQGFLWCVLNRKYELPATFQSSSVTLQPYRLNIFLGQSLRSWYCRPWTVGSYAAYLPRLSKVERGTKRTSKRRPSRKHVENRTPKLRLQQRPWSCVAPWTPLKRKVGAPTYDDCTRRSLVHLATSESIPSRPPTTRPCTWHPEVGAQSVGIGLTGGSCCLGSGHGTPRRPPRRCGDRDSSARLDTRGAHRRVAGREVRAFER